MLRETPPAEQVSLVDKPQELLQREVLVDEVLKQIGKGSSNTFPGPGVISEMHDLLLWFASLPDWWEKKEHFLEIPKEPEEAYIWKGDFLVSMMLPERVNGHLKEYDVIDKRHMAFRRKTMAMDLLEFPEQVSKWAKLCCSMQWTAFRGPLDKMHYQRVSKKLNHS